MANAFGDSGNYNPGSIVGVINDGGNGNDGDIFLVIAGNGSDNYHYIAATKPA
jgi:hypothetical protein